LYVHEHGIYTLCVIKRAWATDLDKSFLSEEEIDHELDQLDVKNLMKSVSSE
jgi:hypothetical protein